MSNIIRNAYRFLRYDRSKSIGILIGIIICVFLVGQQVGIYTALKGNMGFLNDNADTDIWVISTRATDIFQLDEIDARLAYSIQSIPGVMRTHPMIVTQGMIQFQDGFTEMIIVIGSDPPFYKAGPAPDRVIRGSMDNLLQPDAVTMDLVDILYLESDVDVGTEIEINGKRAVVSLVTRGAKGFASSIYTTTSNARHYGLVPDNVVHAILVDVEQGVDAAEVVRSINETVYGVRAWSSESFRETTIGVQMARTGIDISTGTMVFFALLSGFFIIGLTMYSSVIDRVRDYGVLKAIGASNRYVMGLILTKAILYATVGFLIAWLFLEGFRMGMYQSGLSFEYSPAMIGVFFLSALFISVFGASFALRRVIRVEPASVFRV
jgi:putative ABC transport system permease protein